MTHEILSVCHSSSTVGHLGVAKTSEKTKQSFYWPGLQEDTNCLSAGAQNVRNVRDRPKSIIIHWWNAMLVTLFTTFELISWDLCVVKSKWTNPCHWRLLYKLVPSKTINRSNSCHNCKCFSGIIGSAVLAAHTAFIKI